jgi:hypothetical protein
MTRARSGVSSWIRAQVWWVYLLLGGLFTALYVFVPP